MHEVRRHQRRKIQLGLQQVAKAERLDDAARAAEEPDVGLPLCDKALQLATALKNKHAEGLALVCFATHAEATAFWDELAA